MSHRRVAMISTTPICGISTSTKLGMSAYFHQLDVIERKRYIQKLSLLNLKEDDDPYLPSNNEKFSDDMSKLPPIEFSHIFCFFIERPGVYTKKQLLQWKSLDGYNYFKSGHVREVKVWQIDATCSLLMASVNPSQNSPEKAHTAWVGVKASGDIIACHCTCMAG